MDEKNMIPIKQEKEKKVEIVKDVTSATDSEKELDSQKEQERKERIPYNSLLYSFLENFQNLKVLFTKILI